MAILLVTYAIRVYITSTRLNAKLKEIRAAGDPICIADLTPAPIPAEQNAAIPLRRIRDDVNAFYEEVKEYYQSKNYETGNPTESQLKTIEAAFDAYPKLVSTIEKAVALKGYDSGLDHTLPPQEFMAAVADETGPARAIARVLTLNVTVLRSHGRSDEAVRATIPLFRLAGHLEQDVVLVQYLVATAIRSVGIEAANEALRSGTVSDETRKSLDSELALADPFPGYIKTLKAERAFGVDSFNSFPLRIQWNGEAIDYLDALEEELRLAAEPYSSYSGTSRKTVTMSEGKVFASLVQPALKSTRDATERTLATIRALRALNALLGRDDPNAPPPADLTELGLPQDATIDPFSGKPLIVKKLPEGWKVYSVGPNLIDDGGKLDYVADYGVGPVEGAAETE
jgi:hypothetical protein